MKYTIPDPAMRGRHVQNSGAKRLFGLRPQDPWPAEGMPHRTATALQNATTTVEIDIWVLPLGPGGFRLRAMCACPRCFEPLAIGRLPQHVCKGLK